MDKTIILYTFQGLFEPIGGRKILGDFKGFRLDCFLKRNVNGSLLT